MGTACRVIPVTQFATPRTMATIPVAVVPVNMVAIGGIIILAIGLCMWQPFIFVALIAITAAFFAFGAWQGRS